MPMHSPVHDIGGHFDADATGLGPALDQLLGTLDRPPALLGLGEPTHFVEAFPLLRNQVLAQLVQRHGYRSIALESDCLSATTVNDYVTTGDGDLTTALADFSHGFGEIPANRALVRWLREHNARTDESRQVRFHGFDAPTEYSHAPSPRETLLTAHAYLATHLPGERLPHTAATLEDLAGDDAAWENPEAMFDAAKSVGDTERARTLRLVADDLVALFDTEAPGLRASSSDHEFERAAMHARVAQGLLRYHTAMASVSTNQERHRVLLGLRDTMMAANLAAIAAAEAHRGPCLVFAHNAHLQRNQSRMAFADVDARWWSAGALTAASALRDRYVFVAADHAGHLDTTADDSSVQSILARATPERAIFPAGPLMEVLERHPDVRAHDPGDHGYSPLQPDQIRAADAVAFVTSAPL